MANKKCTNTQTKQSSRGIKNNKQSKRFITGIFSQHKRRPSADRFYTSSSVGAVTSLILMLLIGLSISLVANVGIAADTYATINISISTTTLSTDILVTSPSGTYAKSDDMNINVSTDGSMGYTLSIAGTSANTPTPLSGSNGTIPSISNSATVADFSSGSDTGYNDKWGYMPSMYHSTNNLDNSHNAINIYPAPTNNGDIINATSSANPVDSSGSSSTGLVDDNYTLSFGTRLTTDTSIGSYSGNFVITAVANFAEFAINYYPGTASSDTSLSNMPVDESGYVPDTPLTLSSKLPERHYYAFTGWCVGTENTSNITTTDNVDSCSSTVYPVAGNVPVTQYSQNTLHLYAMWEKRLYNTVASLVKLDGNGQPRTQTLADMQAVITEPTSNDPATDTSNSGVFLYDASTFGTASDASNDYDIYYYRGQLDEEFTSSDSYGGMPSTGDSYYYPNYVVLSGAKTKSGITTNDTCWRITRTTGSGGVKMIYNGKWTGSTCANAGGSAAADTTYFNRGAGYESTPDSNCDTADNAYCGTLGFTTMVGYNYNSTYAVDTTATDPVSNSILFNNETPSNARTRIETWFNSTNLTTYAATNRLETDAGWCDDRTTTASPSESDTTVPYSTDTLTFGAYRRNIAINKKLSLTCPNPTGNDLLTTSNGLGAPLAPLTADEAALAGHGHYHHSDDPTVATTYSSNYAYQSFLRSGSLFWLLSPAYRYSDGLRMFGVHANGYSNDPRTFWTRGLRPAISLTPGTTVASGAGTSTDPWIVNP